MSKDTLTKGKNGKAEQAATAIAGSLLGILEEKGVFDEEKIGFRAGVSTGDGGEKHVSLDVEVNECYAGQLLFHPARGVWYFLTDPQPLLDGTEVGDIAGESSDFTSAVRGLCKSKWPKLWKEMDL